MSMLNRLASVHNPFQGEHKRVLCVCSAGLLRSPTAAMVLSGPPWDFNTRAAGCVPEYALVPIDDALIVWAEEIVCMEEKHAEAIKQAYPVRPPIVVLGILDNFRYRDPELMRLIGERYEALSSKSGGGQ